MTAAEDRGVQVEARTWRIRRYIAARLIQAGLRVAFGRKRGRELAITLHEADR
jgi:hypothetical protein